ncbi:MAG: hypothetical protein GYB31_18750 [Bacteroidetes bacterium]|nr:hypothetical protein [Bacteroidota bacterium]
MSKPIVKFLQDPPIEINCQEDCEVKLSITPNAPGLCKVVVSTLLQSCTFKQSGTDEVEVEVECQEGETEVECSILIQMQCQEPDEYFTLLMAKAINSEEETSFRKPIEATIKCGPTV